MPPAARVTDQHVCPMSDGPKPHVGGPILPPCMPTVMTGGLPQARVGDMATCVGPPDMIAMGSPTVHVGGMMAARQFDTTVHGGKIIVGFPTVIIGEAGGGSVAVNPMVVVIATEGKGIDPKTTAATIAKAAEDGTPFCEQCAKMANN